MGIPLYRINDIRRLYKQDPLGDSKIDFDKYVVMLCTLTFLL